MVPGMEMMACPNLAVPAEVMQHVVNVESSRNPFAIGVVGAQLVRQPQNLGEAVATVRMLEEKGYNYSLGVAQVNRSNLGKFGLDTYEKAFEFCPNLVAGSQILAQCYASAGNDWGKAFSCYYSGNFTTGYEDGYVQKIFDSMARSAAASATAVPIQLVSVPRPVTLKGTPVYNTDSSASRVAMRSVADAAVSAAIAPVVASAAGLPASGPNRTSPVVAGYGPSAMEPDAASVAQVVNAAAAANDSIRAGANLTFPPNGAFVPNGAYTAPAPAAPPVRIPTDPGTAAIMSQIGAQLPTGNAPTGNGRIATDPATAAVMSQIGVSAQSNGMPQASDNGVFVPQVQGPNDPPPASVAPASSQPVRPGADPADLRQGGGDGAFVF